MGLPLLLLGAGGSAAYDEYALSQVAAAYPVVLAAPAVPAWVRPHLDHHLAVDPADASATAAAAVDYANYRGLGGILPLTPEHLRTAAYIAGRLDWQAESIAALAACTDRPAVLDALLRRRVPTAPWARASSSATGQDPRVSARQATTVLVENAIESPLVSAETVVLGPDDIRIAAITRTTLGPRPARQPVRHCVYAHDPLLHNRFVRQQVVQTVKALGLSRGVVHIEMRLTSRGPRIADVTPALAGDLIPLLVERATGIDLPRAAADLAAGQLPDLAPTRQRAAAVHFAYSTISGHIHRVTVSTSAYQPLVDRVGVTRDSGQYVYALSHAGAIDRLAHWVVLGATPDGCHTALDQMVRDLRLDLLPAASASGRRAS
ncbi:hypothetical protein [Streptomyces sp. MN13]